MASANNLGTAYIKIAPQMQGIQKSISDGLASIKTSSLPGAAAVGTVVAKGVSAAMNLVTSSLDGAIKRTDILNNFPRVMQNLGISTEDAQKSIDRLVEGLDGLPTALQDGASAVQRFTSRNNDVAKSTEIFLALNNAILAGGASAEIQTSALEQMSQAYAKGKPDMMEWRTLMMAMPAQLNQVAKSMDLGENAADKLGESLRKGEISMDDFMSEIIKLNKQGVGNLASFEDQARGATEGIGTALTNMRNRAQKAVSSIIQSFGSKDISDAINKFSSSFAGIADWIGKNVVPIIKNTLIPILKNVLSAVKSVVEFIANNKWVQDFLVGLLGTIMGYKAVKSVVSILSSFASGIASIGKSAMSHIGNIKTLVSSFAEAKSAGFSFGEAAQYAGLSVGGLGGKITGLIGNIGNGVSSLASLAGCLGGLAAALVGVGGAIFNVNMIIQELGRQEQETAYKARELAARQINLENAQKHVNDATRLGTDILNNYQSALDASKNTELAMLNAKKQVAYKQEELNKLAAEGKEGTDDYRIAQLELEAAESELTQKTKEHAEAQEQVNAASAQFRDNSMTSVNELNKLTIATEAQQRQYGIIASQLDALKNKTMTYKDANGELAETTKEYSAESSMYLAEQLARTDETWAGIVQIANEKGVSFAEACALYAQEAGQNVPGQFSVGLQSVSALATDATQDLTDQIAQAADMKEDAEIAGRSFTHILAQSIQETENLPKDQANKLAVAVIKELGSHGLDIEAVGKAITSGTAKGVLDNAAKNRLLANVASVIRAAVAKMKAEADIHSPSKVTAEVGKFMTLGLSEGIDDYAEDAVESAREAASKTLEAFNESANMDSLSGMYRLAPQSGLTSGMNGSGGQVIQNNEFYVDSELDVKEVSKRLGWQVATAL